MRERRNAPTTREVHFFSARVAVMSWPSDDSLRVKGDTAVIATPESTSAARRLLPDTQQKIVDQLDHHAMKVRSFF
jgi:hypothetical protein